jgi:hypothetical protein
VDLALVDLYRDRERGVKRYNAFRRDLGLPPIRNWSDLTDDKEQQTALQEVYGDDVDKLDLLVGSLAEKKLKGFAISDTAFRIFIVVMKARHIHVYNTRNEI